MTIAEQRTTGFWYNMYRGMCFGLLMGLPIGIILDIYINEFDLMRIIYDILILTAVIGSAVAFLRYKMRTEQKIKYKEDWPC